MQATRIKLAGLLTVMIGGLMIFRSFHAEILKWVNEKGEIHFTEDPTTILFIPIY